MFKQLYAYTRRTPLLTMQTFRTLPKGPIEALHNLDVANGRGGNRFMPNETATLVEVIVMLLGLRDLRD